jgi:molecular chaperone GrpE
MRQEKVADTKASQEGQVQKIEEEALTRVAESEQPPSGSVDDTIAEGEAEKLRAEVNKYRDLALRSAADLDNYRKRMAREKEEATRYANTSFLEKLIPILDNFELGLQAAQGAAGQSAIMAGMTMVQKQLADFLAGCGVEAIEATGAKFDPNLHEAIAQEESAEVEEGVVIRQVRRGYRLRDRLIRPANVVVSKGSGKSSAAEPGSGKGTEDGSGRVAPREPSGK